MTVDPYKAGNSGDLHDIRGSFVALRSLGCRAVCPTIADWALWPDCSVRSPLVPWVRIRQAGLAVRPLTLSTGVQIFLVLLCGLCWEPNSFFFRSLRVSDKLGQSQEKLDLAHFTRRISAAAASICALVGR